MGYYSTYKLEIKPDIATIQLEAEIAEAFHKQAPGYFRFDDDGKPGDDLLMFLHGEPKQCKWYDFDSDIIAVSKQFPTLGFAVHRIGEEHGDVEALYAIGGVSESITPDIPKTRPEPDATYFRDFFGYSKPLDKPTDQTGN